MGLSVTTATAGDDGSWDVHPESIRLRPNRKTAVIVGLIFIFEVSRCVFILVPFTIGHAVCVSADNM